MPATEGKRRLATIERDFFRVLNRVVEPAVKRGLFSPRHAPAGLILLETTGFKTGATRRTPLLATRLGRYVFVSTVRGERSFWVKNLQAQNRIRYFLGGRAREADAYVLSPRADGLPSATLPAPIARLADLLAPLTQAGWAFAVLKTH